MCVRHRFVDDFPNLSLAFEETSIPVFRSLSLLPMSVRL